MTSTEKKVTRKELRVSRRERRRCVCVFCRGSAGIGRCAATLMTRSRRRALAREVDPEAGAPEEDPGERQGDDEEQPGQRSEEHTSELQSLRHLVCRLLLEKR